VTGNKASNFAQRFLNSKLQAGRNKAVQQQPYGSKWPNKHPWKNIVNSLNSYNLTNAQKNMIRRVNIAVAAQPIKGRFEKRRRVNMPLSGNRSKNIAAQVNSIKKEMEAARQQNNNKNVFYNAKQTFNNPTSNMNAARQHREAFGN
jgi:hypothetical protein